MSVKANKKENSEFNHWKTLSYWGAFIMIVVIVSMYFTHQRDMTGIKSSAGQISIDKKLKEKIVEQNLKEPTEDIVSSNFFCPANIPTEDNFSPEDTLLSPLRLISVIPDNNYIVEYTKENVADYLNDAYDICLMQFKGIEIITIVNPKIRNTAVKVDDWFQSFSTYNEMTLIVFPKNTILDIELNRSQTKKIRHVYGKADGLGSTCAFIREENILGGILPHEFGHNYSLAHTHQGSLPFMLQGYSCDTGDKVYSTPAPGTGNYVLQADGNCRYDADDPNATESEKIISYSNYMAYTNPACMGKDTVGFLPEQCSKMRAFIDFSKIHREMLLNNNSSFVLNMQKEIQLFLE